MSECCRVRLQLAMVVLVLVGSDGALLLNDGGALVLVSGAVALPIELIEALDLEVGILDSPELS